MMQSREQATFLDGKGGREYTWRLAEAGRRPNERGEESSPEIGGRVSGGGLVALSMACQLTGPCNGVGQPPRAQFTDI